MGKILITGGTGFIGKHLTKNLQSKNYQVVYLSRTENLNAKIKRYKWSLNENFVDEKAFENVETIIHLAGESVAGGLWTKKRKKAILNSRIKSTNLLFETVKKNKFPVKNFICANAVGIYGNRYDEELTENSKLGNDFLANVCEQWQNAAKQFETINVRTATFRIGLVLGKNDGVLPNLVKPAKFRMNAILGTGKQFMSWIHIEDLVNIIIKLTEEENLTGNFNAVAPNAVDNATFIKAIEKQLGYKTFKPKVPTFILNTFLGEMATIVLASTKVKPQKIMEKGFNFKYNNIDDALNSLMA